MKKCAIIGLLIAAITGLANPAFAGGVVVIVNKANNNAVDKNLVVQIYNGQFKQWPSGGAVESLVLPDDNPMTKSFCEDVLGRKVAHMKLKWSQMMFSGQALPPKQIASDEDVKKEVSNNVSAIGFIQASSLDDSVKAVIK
jgi:ABC-type phosphate transport system substrate-binding protein